jgi:hypothetical protein
MVIAFVRDHFLSHDVLGFTSWKKTIHPSWPHVLPFLVTILQGTKSILVARIEAIAKESVKCSLASSQIQVANRKRGGVALGGGVFL